MNKTRFVTLILLIVFCFSSKMAFSEPEYDSDKAWTIIVNKWIDANCAIGISKDIGNPVEILSEKYNYYSNNSSLSTYCYKIPFLLGECYYHGEGDKKNNITAVYYYSKSAEKGYSYAKYMLAIMALNKETTNVSFKEAEKYLKESAESGYNSAKYKLASMVLNNQTSVITKEKAEEYMRQSAEGGHAKAKLFIKDHIPSLIASAEKEENNAILGIADNYKKISASLSAKDKERIKICVDKLIKAAENDKKEAMKELAILYTKDNFEFLPKNKEKSKYWIKKYQHELDSIFEQEMAMLDYYVFSGSGKLADRQAKTIINNIKRFNINEITPNKLKGLLLVAIEMSYYNLAYSCKSDVICNSLEKDDFRKKIALPLLTIDSDFKKFYEPIKRLNEKSDWSGNLSDEDNKYFYSLSNGEEKDIWLNAVNKYINIHNSNLDIIKRLKDYFEGLANKIDSEIDLEDIEVLIDLIKEEEISIKNCEKVIENILFDIPTIFASLCVNKKFSDYFISKDEKEKVAKSFSLITSTAFPYTVNNDTREIWFNAVKIIKRNFSENEYKELHNLASKLIPSIELPPNVKLEWPD